VHIGDHDENSMMMLKGKDNTTLKVNVRGEGVEFLKRE